ncbi:MAG: DUF1146 family protein, partial [bacterium]
LILRIILFFIATPFVYKALQALDFSKLFMNNSSSQIRLLLIVLSFIMGYLFIDVIVSLFEHLNGLA